jgi:predicted regulator of Ras-like GTPase activity (Roadblock/LC7/MglB family)
MNRPREDAHWPDTARITRREEPAARAPMRRDDLHSPSTQIVTDRDAYLGQARNDVGRRISDDQVELFVTGDVAQALQREFALHTPEFIALHDVGMSASLRLLSSLAGAAGARVQRLSVRRQGHGVALAVLQFVEVPLADGSMVRVYSTDINADGASRAQLARVLLAFSRLGVLMVGELPPHALAAQFGPLHDSLLQGPWPNRDLLLVPLGSGTALAAQGAQLGHGSAVAVHVTPHAAKPKHVWTFIGGAWNRLHGSVNGERALPTELSRAVPKPKVPSTEATTEPMPLESLDSQRGGFSSQPTMPMPMPVPGTTPWQAYVDRCALIKGCMGACVFDTHSMQVMAQAGGPPAAERLAQQGAALLGAMNDASRALGLGPANAEASITLASHHLLLRPVPGHPGVALHLVLQASSSNLVLARMQLERIAAPG